VEEDRGGGRAQGGGDGHLESESAEPRLRAPHRPLRLHDCARVQRHPTTRIRATAVRWS
jgi:hypothetical protein